MVNSQEGDDVTINFPVILGEALVKMIIASNIGNKDSSDILKSIDFEQIFDLVKKGIIGEIINIKDANGDTVIIRVEY